MFWPINGFISPLPHFHTGLSLLCLISHTPFYDDRHGYTTWRKWFKYVDFTTHGTLDNMRYLCNEDFACTRTNIERCSQCWPHAEIFFPKFVGGDGRRPPMRIAGLLSPTDASHQPGPTGVGSGVSGPWGRGSHVRVPDCHDKEPGVPNPGVPGLFCHSTKAVRV